VLLITEISKSLFFHVGKRYRYHALVPENQHWQQMGFLWDFMFVNNTTNWKQEEEVISLTKRSRLLPFYKI